jgi:hypothetical protein
MKFLSKFKKVIFKTKKEMEFLSEFKKLFLRLREK